MAPPALWGLQKDTSGSVHYCISDTPWATLRRLQACAMVPLPNEERHVARSQKAVGASAVRQGNHQRCWPFKARWRPQWCCGAREREQLHCWIKSIRHRNG
jgi:hypothetical protein